MEAWVVLIKVHLEYSLIKYNDFATEGTPRFILGPLCLTEIPLNSHSFWIVIGGQTFSFIFYPALSRHFSIIFTTWIFLYADINNLEMAWKRKSWEDYKLEILQSLMRLILTIF